MLSSAKIGSGNIIHRWKYLLAPLSAPFGTVFYNGKDIIKRYINIAKSSSVNGGLISWNSDGAWIKMWGHLGKPFLYKMKVTGNKWWPTLNSWDVDFHRYYSIMKMDTYFYKSYHNEMPKFYYWNYCDASWQISVP